ncbi:MAG: hypothetical protein QOJ73_3566 [Streptosporangiaceae bacterium]|jgi:hypothetical protein|nr:hypothetical protein [Streptosporangiaceae bacterium]
MGIRQSAQPLGVAIAALALPTIGEHGRSAALAFLGTFCVAAAALVLVAVRALGIQNTGQNAFAAATPPVLAALIGGAGYGAAFGAVALFPLAAAAFIPVRAEHRAQEDGAQDDEALGPDTAPSAG